MARQDVVCMMRIRNEARWIARSLARTFQVCQKVVLWDDGSNDGTEQEVLQFVTGSRDLGELSALVQCRPWGWVQKSEFGSLLPSNPFELHYLYSPFRPAVRDKQNVSESRDKNALWEYLKAQVQFRHVLCLDGDEVLSERLVQRFDKLINTMEQGVCDIFTMPFIYLWDTEAQRRTDGLYGDETMNDQGLVPRLRVPRLFTIDRITAQQLFDMRFAWLGSLGGFHCGSVPRENFQPLGKDPVGGTAAHPIVHFGYLHPADRQAKFEFYNRIDPNNEFEGCYRHIIGEPDRHAPGPVVLVPWEDTV